MKIKPKARKRARQYPNSPETPQPPKASTTAPNNDLKKLEDQLEEGRKALEEFNRVMAEARIERTADMPVEKTDCSREIERTSQKVRKPFVKKTASEASAETVNSVSIRIEKKMKKVARVRLVSKASPPITPVAGHWIRPKPEFNRMPGFPPYYHDGLIPRTKRIITEAIQKFPLRPQALEFCRYIISELTPEFRAATENSAPQNRLLKHQAVACMESLLKALARANSDSYGLPELERAIESSSELRDFYKEMDRPIDQPMTSANADDGPGLAKVQGAVVDEHANFKLRLEESEHKKGSQWAPPVMSDLAIRGRDCLRIKDEMKKIKHFALTRRLSIGEIQIDHKDFLVWRFVEIISSDEDRQIFRNPRQWAAGYISTFLQRHYGRSNSTIKQWIKAFHQESSQ